MIPWILLDPIVPLFCRCPRRAMESEPADPDARAWALRRALDAVAEASVDMPSGEKSSPEALEMKKNDTWWHLQFFRPFWWLLRHLRFIFCKLKQHSNQKKNRYYTKMIAYDFIKCISKIYRCKTLSYNSGPGLVRDFVANQGFEVCFSLKCRCFCRMPRP